MLLIWNKTKFGNQTTEKSQHEEKALVREEKVPTPAMHHVSFVFRSWEKKILQ